MSSLGGMFAIFLWHGFYFIAIMLTFACETMNSVSSLASFMSNQETSFVTLGQRVLANPLK